VDLARLGRGGLSEGRIARTTVRSAKFNHSERDVVLRSEQGGPGTAGACADEQAGTEQTRRTRSAETLWDRASAWGG